MTSKVKSALLLVFLLIMFFSLSHGGRPATFFSNPSLRPEKQLQDADEMEEICEGLSEEEECLMRRTLLAHTDYIYTQKQNP